METLDPNERFRERRRAARRRKRMRRSAALIALLLAAAAVAIGARGLDTSSSPKREVKAPTKTKPQRPAQAELPAEVRGVHVTMALASIPGKLDEYAVLPGLNTIELDVKDENGEIAFHTRAPRLARQVGAAMRYYDPKRAAARLHRQGIYVVGRVVCFEDPILSEKRPALGLGWTNPYSEHVWNYNLDVAKAAVRAGFDEVQFDYVRFPSDGDIESAVFL